MQVVSNSNSPSLEWMIPQSPEQVSKSYLGVQLDAVNKYLDVITRKKILKAIPAKKCTDIPQYNYVQGQLFQKVIHILKYSEPFRDFKNPINCRYESSPSKLIENTIEEKAKIIAFTFYQRLQQFQIDETQYHQKALACFMKCHMKAHFFSQSPLLPEIPQEQKKEKNSSSKNRLHLPLHQLSHSTSLSSSPKKSSPKITLSPRHELAIKSLNNEGIEFCRTYWIHNNFPKIIPATTLNERISHAEYLRIEKSELIKTPLMQYLIEEQVNRMLTPMFNKHSLAQDIKRNLHRLDVFCQNKPLLCRSYPEYDKFTHLLKEQLKLAHFSNEEKKETLKVWELLVSKKKELLRIEPFYVAGEEFRANFKIKSLKNTISALVDFYSACEKFYHLLETLLIQSKVPRKEAEGVLETWRALVNKSKKKKLLDESFERICMQFLSYLGNNQYENKLFMLLVALTQQVYVFPALSLLEVIPGIPFVHSKDSVKLKYHFFLNELPSFQASTRIALSKDPNRFPSDKFHCPEFEIVLLNKITLSKDNVWRSALEIEVHLDKAVNRKEIDHLIRVPLHNVGINISFNWNVAIPK